MIRKLVQGQRHRYEEALRALSDRACQRGLQAGRTFETDRVRLMTGSEFIAGIFPYIAVALCLLCTAWRFVHWLSLPAHVKWTLYPAPEGIAGQLRYMAKEMFTFETLYKFNRRLWFGSFSMHMAMAGAVLFFILYLAGWSTMFVVQFCLLAHRDCRNLYHRIAHLR